LLRIKVKLSNDGNSNLLCYKKPWYQGKNPNLAVKFGFQGDRRIFAKNNSRQNNNFKIIINKNNICAVNIIYILDDFFKIIKFVMFFEIY